MADDGDVLTYQDPQVGGLSQAFKPPAGGGASGIRTVGPYTVNFDDIDPVFGFAELITPTAGDILVGAFMRNLVTWDDTYPFDLAGIFVGHADASGQAFGGNWDLTLGDTGEIAGTAPLVVLPLPTLPSPFVAVLMAGTDAARRVFLSVGTPVGDGTQGQTLVWLVFQTPVAP